MVGPVVAPLFGVAVAFTKVLLRSTNNNLSADIIDDTAGPLAEISQLVLGKKGSKKQVERAIKKDLATRMRDMNERCYREGIDPSRLASPCAEVEAVLDTIGDHNWILETAVRDPDALRTYFREQALKQRAQVDERLVPYFDELIKAVVEQYIAYAERSPDYLHVAAKQSLKNDKESRESAAKILHAVDDVRHMVGKFASSDSKPSRVFFGSRPEVVTGDRYIERDEHEHLKALIADRTQRRTVLVGMRGCGKTQLASTLAQQCEDAHWSLVAWVNAGSPESITSNLVELAKELEIDTSDQPTAETIIRRLFNRLKSADPSDRLIVFDNVENIADLRGLLPSGKGLRVVATTTNNTGWGHQGWDTIKVGVFGRDESINYLLTVTKSDDHDAAYTLARRLGDLPLALAQAAATALNEDWTLTQYLRRLETHRSEQVIHLNPGDEYPLDLYRALRMAIRGALNNLDEGTRRAARRQLGALALLAESGVPTHWLDPMSEEPNDAEFQDHDRAADEDAHNALTKLIHRSIVQQSADRATTMFHRLQAQVLRESWSEEEREQACESAATLLESVDIEGFPRDATALLRKETRDLIEQLRALGTQKDSHPLFDTEQIRSCLMRAFVDANELGLTDEALTLQHGVEIIQSLMGSAHSDVLVLQNNLATTYEKAGRLNEAITLFEQVLADRIRILGDKHPDTLASRNNLAGAYLAANRPEESIALYEQVLTDRIGILSDDHPDTLASRNNLAYAYQSIGCFTKAISQVQQVLADSIRILGEDHPRTLTARNNLAYSYVSAGKFTIATPIFEQVLADSIRILGEDHPHTLTSRNNLAYAYKEEGRLTEAIDLYEQVSANSIRVLGSVHPETLSSRNNLACAYAAAGRITEAITQFEQVLTDCTRILDENHPLTKTVRENLEAVRRELEQQEEDSANEEREQED